MVGIHTSRRVASMTDAHPARNRSVRQGPRHTVRPLVELPIPDHAMPELVRGPRPQKTSMLTCDRLRGEPLRDGLAWLAPRRSTSSMKTIAARSVPVKLTPVVSGFTFCAPLLIDLIVHHAELTLMENLACGGLRATRSDRRPHGRSPSRRLGAWSVRGASPPRAVRRGHSAGVGMRRRLRSR